MVQILSPIVSGSSSRYTWLYDENHQRIKETRTITGGTLAGTRTTWYLHPDNAGSQFFICHGDPTFLDRQYTTFGKLIKGDDVLEKIATTKTHPPDRPDVVHQSLDRQSSLSNAPDASIDAGLFRVPRVIG